MKEALGTPFSPLLVQGEAQAPSPVSFSRWHRRPGRCTGTLLELGISGRAVERRGEVSAGVKGAGDSCHGQKSSWGWVGHGC